MSHETERDGLAAYAVRVYAAQSVADACLRAQDACGMDVNLLLYAGWLAARGVVLTPAAIRDAESRCRPLREAEILPRRERRRRLAAAGGADAEYAAAKAAELEAELQQLALLETLEPDVPASTGEGDALARSFGHLCEHYAVPGDSLARLNTLLAPQSGARNPPD